MPVVYDGPELYVKTWAKWWWRGNRWWKCTGWIDENNRIVEVWTPIGNAIGNDTSTGGNDTRTGDNDTNDDQGGSGTTKKRKVSD